MAIEFAADADRHAADGALVLLLAQVVVEVFDLGRQVVDDHGLDAAADHVADVRLPVRSLESATGDIGYSVGIETAANRDLSLSEGNAAGQVGEKIGRAHV